jgi:excisionase family DNA binding protein
MAEAASMSIDARRAPLLLTGPRLVGVSPVARRLSSPSSEACSDDVARRLELAPRLLEVSHVAHRLSRSQGYVRRLIRAGKLEALRVEHRWRVEERALEAYLERCRQEAQRRVQRPFPG